MCRSAYSHASSTLDSEIHCSLVLSSVTRHGALITASVIHRRGNNDKGTRRKEPRRKIPNVRVDALASKYFADSTVRYRDQMSVK